VAAPGKPVLPSACAGLQTPVRGPSPRPDADHAWRHRPACRFALGVLLLPSGDVAVL